MAGLSLGAFTLSGGCNKEKDGASPGGGTGAPSAGGKVNGTVGYVDLDRVIAQIGWRGDLDNDFHAAEAELNRQLDVYRNSVIAAWDAKRKSIADAAHLNADQVKTLSANNESEIRKLPLSQAQKDDFFQSNAQGMEAVNRSRQMAQQTLNARETKIIESIREAMKPAVRRVAAAANISMVIAPPANNNPVFYYDPSVDLSDPVVDDLRKGTLRPNFPEMPRLNLPIEFRFGALQTLPTVPTPATIPAAAGATTVPAVVPTTQGS